MQNAKNKFITFFSIILILFGTIGAIGSVIGVLVLNSYSGSFKKVHELSLAVGESIELTSSILKNANITSIHIAESIGATKDTIKYASMISYDTGIAFEEMSAFVGFDILGFKPLEETEDYFKDIGTNLIGLSEELDTAVFNIETNASDLDVISGDLEIMSEKLGDIALKYNNSLALFNINNLVLIIKYLLVYLGIFHIIFIINGIIFLALKK